MVFLEGWWCNELTRPNTKEHIPDMQMDYSNLLQTKYEADNTYEEFESNSIDLKSSPSIFSSVVLG